MAGTPYIQIDDPVLKKMLLEYAIIIACMLGRDCKAKDDKPLGVVDCSNSKYEKQEVAVLSPGKV